MKLHPIFSHMFLNRGFLGLVASVWGFMLGGSLLMTVTTYLLAIAGLSRFSVLLYQFVVLGMLCGAAWVIMDFEYTKNNVKKVPEFLAVFLLSAGFGVVIPIIFAIGAFVTYRDEIRNRAVQKQDTAVFRSRQMGLAGFLQELMKRSFLKLAH